jgi:hypothetical protein
VEQLVSGKKMAPGPCIWPGCPNPKRSLDLCVLHYDRQLHGRDMDAPVKWGVAKLHFETHVMEPTPVGCRMWPYSTAGQGGYGHLVVKGKTIYVHIATCEAWYGPKPSPEMEVAHSCDNPACWAGEHLRWATSAENKADSFTRKRAYRGDRSAAMKKAWETRRAKAAEAAGH